MNIEESERLKKIITELEELMMKQRITIEEERLFLKEMETNFKRIEVEIKDIWTTLSIFKYKIQEIERKMFDG